MDEQYEHTRTLVPPSPWRGHYSAAMGLDEEAWRAKAAANLLEARRKNGRLGVKKSRSGCTTCKERRIKCDEEKPECKKCMLSGRRCGGYSPSPPSSISARSARSASASPPLQHSPSMALRLRDSEKRTYDYFLSCASLRLAGPLGKDFWHGYILQLAHTEPLVTDCLLAISTLYEHPQFMVSFRRNPYDRTPADKERSESLGVLHPHVPPPPDKYHASALQKYNQAIKQFKERLEHGSAAPYLVLTSCALFFCIEVIRDNVFAALSLVNNGMKLLKDYGPMFSESQQADLFRMFKLMFSRLGVTAATIGYALPTKDLPRLTTVGSVDVFPSITEARDALFAIMSDSRDYLTDAAAWKDAFMSSNSVESSSDRLAIYERTNVLETMYGASYRWTDEREIPERQTYNTLPSAESACRITNERIINEDVDIDGYLQPESPPNSSRHSTEIRSELQSARFDLLSRLQWWLHTFEATNEHISHPDPETNAFLFMYYNSTLIWASTRLSLTETAFDDFTSHFEQIVHYADVYLSSHANDRATFTFETGAVAPLFLTATRCRIPSLRRQALDLMRRAPRKECFHGAESTAEVAGRVIDIEEEGLARLEDDLPPPEAFRVHKLELMKTPGTQLHEITVTRYSNISDRFVPEVKTFAI